MPACGCRFIDRPTTPGLAFLSRSRLLQHCRSGYPAQTFFKRLIIGASLFAGCSLVTQLLLAESIPLPLILTGLTLVLGVTAEISPLHARLLPASLIAAIFTLSLAGYMPVWEPLLIYALGTLWYGVFNWFWFWLWREQRCASH